MLLTASIRPILVFDGANLPAKSDTESKRRSSKKANKEKAAQFLLEGNRKAAQECFERCVDVTPEMARTVIQAARKLGVDCIVAPYESDAQLAYLVQSGYADLVITEDSDLLMFGCKQVIFKLDLSGSGVLITWSAGIGEHCCNIPSQDFTPASLRFIGVLAGCDYFPGIPRIGLATAAKILRQCRTNDFRYLLSNLGQFFNLPDSACLPPDNSASLSQTRDNGLLLSSSSSLTSSSSSNRTHKPCGSVKKLAGGVGSVNQLHEATIHQAMRAERTFRLQVVFDPRTRQRRRLSRPTLEDIQEERLLMADIIDEDASESLLFAYAGDDETDRIVACALALSNIDFYTMAKVGDFIPEMFEVKKLYSGKDKQEHANMHSISMSKSVFQVAHRPDGRRLNTSVWSMGYKLQPVWLYFTSESGSRQRPFCICVNDEVNDSQQLVTLLQNGLCDQQLKENNGRTDLLPSKSFGDEKKNNNKADRLRLNSPLGYVPSRGHRVFVSPIFTPDEQPMKRGGDEGQANAAKITRALDSSGGGGNEFDQLRRVPRTPLRSYARSETPVVSASNYFASPVSAVLGGYEENPSTEPAAPKSPIFHNQIPLSVFDAPAVSKTRAFIASPSVRASPSPVNRFAIPRQPRLSATSSPTMLSSSSPSLGALSRAHPFNQSAPVRPVSTSAAASPSMLSGKPLTPSPISRFVFSRPASTRILTPQRLGAPTRSAGAEAPPLGRQFSFTARKPLPPSLPTTENEGRQPQIERTRATTELLVDLYKENDPPGSPVYAEHPVLIDAEDEHEEKVVEVTARSHQEPRKSNLTSFFGKWQFKSIKSSPNS